MFSRLIVTYLCDFYNNSVIITLQLPFSLQEKKWIDSAYNDNNEHAAASEYQCALCGTNMSL